ncbi:MAG TPA: hypothetical protein VJ461_06355 [Candidatus Nanoarchaeia archaeon]|nr:hypothetical protein [Candidatus Nanoarchaeia archaeon]
MSKKGFIYLLPEYANNKNLQNIRSKTEDEYKIKYSAKGMQIELTENNSLIEEEYCLNLKSAKYLLEGTEVKESMIHHHEKGSVERHLQFKLQAKKETIRIFLTGLDTEDYEKCIKGFLHISQDLIVKEQKENKIKDNLKEYFFNEKIQSLAAERRYLLKQISSAFKAGNVLDISDKSIDDQKLLELKDEDHLRLFLEW